MTVNKMGSKLAQGVRQVMQQQGKAPEDLEKAAEKQVVTRTEPAAKVSAAVEAKVLPKTSASQQSAEYKMRNPERIWPD